MKFSESLEALMKEKGESNYRLAKEIGVSQTTVANWLSGKNEPIPSIRKLLDQHFGVTVGELLREDSNDDEHPI